jgi:hypothetical protein
MAALKDNPPVLPPLAFDDGNLGLSASLPSYSASSHPPPIYNERGASSDEFHTIPLHDALSAKPTKDERRDTMLMAYFLITASVSFSLALVICVLLSAIHKDSPLTTPIPQLLFAMSVFLIISGGLLAKGVRMWLQKKARQKGPYEPADMEKEVKVDIHVHVEEVAENPQKIDSKAKQKAEK